MCTSATLSCSRPSARSRGAGVAGGGDVTPKVTVIIPAYNEAKVIREKVENVLRIDYPRECLEIVVASDGSDDGTDEIVREYEGRGVKLRAFAPRAGKISVLNRTVPEAEGEIVVLCDANVMFRPDALNHLVPHFANPRVGAVTGDVRIQTPMRRSGRVRASTTNTNDSSSCRSRSSAPR